jgi:hypothetical protein
MRAARLTTVAVVILATLLVAPASAREAGPPAAPTSLHGFLLRPNEPVTHTFSRTPAFAWAPVRGAACYEFELATSRTFDESALVWSNVAYGARSGKLCRPVIATSPAANEPGSEGGEAGAAADVIRTVIAPIKIPATSVNLVLPWFTGKPYALYAHARAITARGPTGWSKAFGFDMRWEELPVPLAGRPGLVRWTTVEGATGYEVFYPDIRKLVRTHTNVADMREFYLFHLDSGWWSTVRWRVRPVRVVSGSTANGLPAVSYGPWSPVFAATNPDWAAGPLQVKIAISDEVSEGLQPSAHQLMPGLTFTGDRGLDGVDYRLFRAYAFTDRDCVNAVFRGSVVGGFAYAPRASGPLKLPKSLEDLDAAMAGVLLNWKDENAKTFASDTVPVVANETILSDAAGVDLPDVDRRTTQYYWTVVPVAIYINEENELEYHDVNVPQDHCEGGSIVAFRKESKPVITASGAPYVSGLTPTGRLLASAGKRPVVYSTPLVAWRPVVGATAYEIQWSRTTYPWRARGRLVTFSTSSLLNVRPGLWYYRVRGLNGAQVGTPAMTWSAPAAVRVVRPTFRIASP